MTTQQYPPPGNYPPPQVVLHDKRRGRVHWGWLVLVFFVGIGFGSMGDSSPAPQQTSASSVPTRQAPAAVQPAPQVQAAPAVPDLSQGIPEGEYLVPSEIEPGKYRSTGAKPGLIELCSAAVHSGDGKVMEWKTGGRGEQVLITIGEGATSVSNTNCELFTKVG